MSQEPSPLALPAYDQLLGELKALRRPGLPDLRNRSCPALAAVARAAGYCDADAPDAIPAGIEALLAAAVRHLGENDLLGKAAAQTFGLAGSRRGAPAVERRKAAAALYGVSSERFRRHQEPQVIEQLAQAVLIVARRPFPAPAVPSAPVGPEPPLSVPGVPVGERGAITLHVSPIELLRDIDILVSPENIYLEPSKTFHPTVSGALRLAAAERDPATGHIHDDVLARELSAWLHKHGRHGLPVGPGTVVPTSPGRLADRGVRRVYHAAVATPQGWNYQVQPETVARAVAECFALARAERRRIEPEPPPPAAPGPPAGAPPPSPVQPAPATPPTRRATPTSPASTASPASRSSTLSSICFPLLGAGRGGLPHTTSATWLRWAIHDELAHDDSWQVHLVVRTREVAESIGAL